MGNSKTILLIDDDRDIHIICRKYMEDAGFFFQSALSGREGLEKLQKGNIDLVLLDYTMPNMNGLGVIQEYRVQNESMNLPFIPFIMLTVISAEMIDPSNLLTQGVEFILKKPFGYPELMNIIENIFIRNEIRKEHEQETQKNVLLIKELNVENRRLRSQIQETYDFSNIIGSTPTMLDIFKKVSRIAKTDANVFIYGESGTGKELIARSIHAKSHRNGNAFVTIDCVAFPPPLLEKELFGQSISNEQDNGNTVIGSLQQAHEGSLFFDEICELSADLQAKLIRVIQENQFCQAGTNNKIQVDIRMISASNCVPETAVHENKLREDLYYRLNVIPIRIPPLRERKVDIPLLVNYFIHKFQQSALEKPIKLSPEAMRILKNYHWPGNVRELQNVIERVISLSANRPVQAEDLPEHILHNSEVQSFLPTPDMPLKEARKKWMEKFERNYLIELLTRCNGNISEVARVAQSNRMTVYRMIKNYNISTKKFTKK